MNYRHHFHAGNFADVWKHVLLRATVQALQRKEKGFLYLDTHAGRGTYNLEQAARGTTLERRPEWPEGIGRVETQAGDDAPALVQDYVAAVRQFAAVRSPIPTEDEQSAARLYPGSPWLVKMMLRPQDRAMLFERQPEEGEALRQEFSTTRRARVEIADGYQAVRACLPPPERRALVLIDPPYEAADEFERVAEALSDGLRRLPGGTFLVWYPLSARAPIGALFEACRGLALPPTWLAEYRLFDNANGPGMHGCGVLVLNPPWRLDQETQPALQWLARTLAQSPESRVETRWVVPE